MSGYRDTSNFDPYGQTNYGRPLRPFNWVQWTGVALELLGVAIYIAFILGSFGWTRKLIDTPAFGMAPLFLGISLINSRREERTDPAPELAGARRKWLAIVVAICSVILGIATIFALKGY